MYLQDQGTKPRVQEWKRFELGPCRTKRGKCRSELSVIKKWPPPVLTILSRCAWEVESDRKFLGSGVTLPIPNRDAGTINVSSIKRLEEAAIRNFQ